MKGKMIEKYFLYKITNLINNLIYIGQTNDLKIRWKNHISGSKASTTIDLAIKTFGKHNFIIELLPDEVYYTRTEVNVAERNTIEKYNSRDPKIGYNVHPGGNAHNQDIRTIERIRETMLAKNIKLSEEAKKKLSEERMGAGNPAFGTKHSEERKKAISRNLVGNNYGCKITYNDAEQIRTLFIIDRKINTISVLATKYNISDGSIKNILRNKTYKTDISKNLLQPRIILNKEKVYEIKDLIKNKVQQKEIAKQFNISDTLVSYIKHNKVWRNI